MAEAIALARRGWGRVHPNPLVGAVVVQDGVIVGKGWHAEYGGLHAEPAALREAGDRARGGTLFVTLEPCAHTGKQPPCVDAILGAGVSRVVYGLTDPDPVARGGAERLRAAGVEVVHRPENQANARDNFRFLHRFGGAKRPFVAVKLAVSLDGMVADHEGNSRWISGPAAREWVHWLRAGFGAVAVGGRTAVEDDVRLTVRGAISPRMAPTRVIFDRGGRMPPTHGILADAADVPVVVVVGPGVSGEQVAALAARGATVLAADGLPAALDALGERGIDSLLVEGGGRLAGALREAGAVDRLYLVMAPLWLGGGRPAWPDPSPVSLEAAPRWRIVDTLSLGDDVVLTVEP